MIVDSSSLKLAGYPLAFGMPLLAPLGVWLDIPWLAPLIVFGFFPVLGLVVGEDRSLPIVGLRRSSALGWDFDFLPPIYAVILISALAWAVTYLSPTELTIRRPA